ncbi:FecR domain-containing protein [Lonsdalea britannica]|uniref:FecR domain-containing protein n=1 Tax=Lonsdalea britannica TaxID=1082704 RepID=UPI0026E9F594|nr:FecR domain-containing protein [Lonsdalea britannica]
MPFPPSPPTKPGFESLQEAADWYAQLLEEDGEHSELHRRWQRWLDESAEHREAWIYVQTISQRFQPLRGELHQPSTDALLRSPRVSRRRALKLTALLTSGALLSWMGYRYTPLRGSLLAMAADNRTVTGEIKQVTLSDGSRIWLDTASAMDIRYTTTERQLILRSGQIFIATAPDQQRPFIVVSDQGRMQALGTRFSVSQQDESTQLNVYDGIVAVTPRQESGMRRITAGQQWRFTADGQGTLDRLDSLDADWRTGKLSADDTPLGEVIARLSRYRRGHLSCAPDIAALRLMGTFPLDNTDRALEMISRALPIRINRRFSWWVTVEKKV